MIDGGLNAIFRKYLPHLGWSRIESGSTAGGVPDLNYCIDGNEHWLELKKCFSGRKVKVRPAQVGWIESRLRHGGRVKIAVRRKIALSPRRATAFDDLYLFKGDDIRPLADHGLYPAITEAALYHGEGGPARWNWSEIEKILRGE